MNVVKNLQEFIQLIHSSYEVILFPIGAEGQQFLEFLKYSNFLHRIGCIAVPKVGVNNSAYYYVHDVPAIPFEHLVHFRETAIFIVAGPENHYPNLENELTRYGCRKVVFVKKEVITEAEKEIQRMASTGQIMMWYLRRFDGKITELENRLEEQNEIAAVNTKAFAEFQNAFRDRDVVIVASGPTLNYYKPIPNAIHIGVNFSYRNNHVPLDYHFFVDLPNNNSGTAEFKKEIAKVEEKVKEKIFIRRHRNRVDENAPAEDFTFISKKVVRFFAGASADYRFFQNICYHPLREHWNVVFSALHFAFFTYPKRIFLTGCDLGGIGHFYAEKNASNWAKEGSYSLNKVKINYALMKMFARDYYPSTEIISINPVGLRGLFKDVYTDEYRKALEEEKNK